eukprot:scaffold800_cov93-Skeletonema_marinoi.AAC.1
MHEPCQRCFYTIIANCIGPLEAVDCHIHSVSYDMVLKVSAALSRQSSMFLGNHFPPTTHVSFVHPSNLPTTPRSPKLAAAASQ